MGLANLNIRLSFDFAPAMKSLHYLGLAFRRYERLRFPAAHALTRHARYQHRRMIA